MAKKIAVFDCCRFKFMRELMTHWENMGHEIKRYIYWDPTTVNWADTVFFDWVDNSLIRASNPEDEFYKSGKYGTRPEGKKIITRCHDIDAWCGHYKNVDWNWVNDLVFVSDYIGDMVKGNMSFPATLKIHTIKHGVDLDKYTFKNRSGGKKIAWIGRIVHHKCLELALQVLAENPEYELHAVGSSLDSWELDYVNRFVERNNLKFFHYPQVDDINQFLEDKNYLLLTSFKEAFSYASAEAMAKGIKPLIHWFAGAEGVWPKEYLWNKVSEVKPMLEGNYDSAEYRNIIQSHYSLEEMLRCYDKLI